MVLLVRISTAPYLEDFDSYARWSSIMVRFVSPLMSMSIFVPFSFGDTTIHSLQESV